MSTHKFDPGSLQEYLLSILSSLPPHGVQPGAPQSNLQQILQQVHEYLLLNLRPIDVLEKLCAIILTLRGQLLIQSALVTLNHPWSRRILSSQPEGEGNLARKLNDRLVGVIYETMPHPATNLTGIEFRSADGSDGLGKAGSVYARTVPVDSTKTVPVKDLPAADMVFKLLMQRREEKVDPHQAKKEVVQNNEFDLSSLTFAYGTLVIHSVFNSDMMNPKINKASSYFDLSPLYGDNQEEQNKIRNKTGRGCLLPDCFLDDRLLFLPPAAAVLLILFNRNHNYIAEELLKHEGKNRGWTEPPSDIDAAKRDLQDEEIFQTARLINCAHFVNIVITDYVGGIMGCAQGGGGWPLNAKPLDDIIQPDMNVGRGEGNLVSVEFNTLYRWHSTLSPADVEWAQTLMGKCLPTTTTKYTNHVDWNNVKPRDYEHAAKAILPLSEPKNRTFNGLRADDGSFQSLERKDGYFADKDLARIMHDAIQSPAGAFRAWGSPGVMAFIDIRGIQRAREMNVCTMNEFREWLGLPKYKTFEEWNAHKEVADAARSLYHDIDKLELYPGLHAEGNNNDGLGKKYGPLRVSTMRIGLLFDAIALIRGDRFFTTAFTPENYTPWGIEDVKRDPSNKAFGGHIHKILFRTLGKYFPEDSVYSWFPMTLPEAMRVPLKNQTGWSFERPQATI